MTDWYRNRHWDAEIAATFEAKIARARTQKAQYLYLQGQALALSHPDVALDLLSRSILEGEEFHIAAAHWQSAYAHLARNDLDSALQSLLAAIEQELRFPQARTGAMMDYAFLVAFHRRSDHYPAAMPIIDGFSESPFTDANLQGMAALALVRSDEGRNEEATAAAQRALAIARDQEESPGDVTLGGVSYAALAGRLEQIAA